MTDQEYLEKLGAKIAKLRQEKGISQLEMARRLETGGNNQIRRIEKGLVNPTIITLMKISRELGLPLENILRF